LQQLWLFWLAPLLGGVAGGLLYRGLFSESTKVDISGEG
jgi:aquaporin Z